MAEMTSAGRPPEDTAFVAALWEHPTLCVALFGVQFLNDEGRKLYQESGIDREMVHALEAARTAGLLLNRPLMSPEGPLLMQYWQSYDALDRWARQQPHSRWWRWLMEHEGSVGFYHEIYQPKAAEAIYERGTRPVGPALFSTLERVKAGEGHSRARQQRFFESAPKPR
ncbi:MAG TPA: phenylacetaldoxime dehydratase family protein [bacterium]|nr:phenylacetaldoxime dehydratase family protein [bacterium]